MLPDGGDAIDQQRDRPLAAFPPRDGVRLDKVGAEALVSEIPEEKKESGGGGMPGGGMGGMY